MRLFGPKLDFGSRLRRGALQLFQSGVGLEHLADGDQALHLAVFADVVVAEAAKARGKCCPWLLTTFGPELEFGSRLRRTPGSSLWCWS